MFSEESTVNWVMKTLTRAAGAKATLLTISVTVVLASLTGGCASDESTSEEVPALVDTATLPTNADGKTSEDIRDGAGEDGQGAGAIAQEMPRFSFFVTSLESMRWLSNSQQGFGGDLRFGESSGLLGADKICSEIAEYSMPGSGAKGWRAFLSAKAGPDGSPVHAVERVGEGPWYDRLGRLVAEDIDGLLHERPLGDAEMIEDLPNEFGEPNHTSGGVMMDNHDVLTGSNREGMLEGPTCQDWTSIVSEDSASGASGGGGFNIGEDGIFLEGTGPMCGHSWVAFSGNDWILSHGVAGCAPSVVEGEGAFGTSMPGVEGGVGDGGGYGGIYCFALSP